jgi:large subunit ribosomal protein L28
MPRDRGFSDAGPEEAELVAIFEKDVDVADQEKYCGNEKGRYFPAAKKNAGVFIRELPGGAYEAHQYKPPCDSELSGTTIRPVGNIELARYEFPPHYRDIVRATTPNGTRMVGKRRTKMTVTHSDGTEEDGYLYRLSPETLWKGEIFAGVGPDKLPTFVNTPPEIAKAPVASKHQKWQMQHQSILEREIDSTRSVDQNTVMGRSAWQEMSEFYLKYAGKGVLHPKVEELLAKNHNAQNMGQTPFGELNWRGEWLHLAAHSLFPKPLDPQVPENLAAGPKYLNTKQMPLERVCKHVGLHRPNAEMHGEVRFNLIPGTHIISDGWIKVTFIENGRTVQLMEDLTPHKRFPEFAKPYDAFHAIHFAFGGLTNRPGKSVLPVRRVLNAQLEGKKRAVPPIPPILPLPTTSSAASMSMVQYTQGAIMPNPTSLTMPVASQGLGVAMPDESAIRELVRSMIKQEHPGHAVDIEEMKKSIVIVQLCCFDYNFEKPWLAPSTGKGHGSGAVIERNGEKFVITNAHVAGNAADLRVRLADENDEYEATVVGKISHQADLALLRVQSQDFQAKARGLQIGGMVRVKEDIHVWGFPLDNEMNYTSGPVSKILVEKVEESGEYHLQIQTQAPINQGNSGGPITNNKNELVGIAFQSQFLSDGIHYAIPAPTVARFIDQVLSPEGYKGFPTLAMNLQNLENEFERKCYGMSENQTGVRIQSIDRLEDAYKHLKKGDILVEIDGVSVSNDAKVNLPGVGNRLDLNVMFLNHNIGETVCLKVLRANKKTGVLEQHVVNVKLNYIAGQTKKVGPILYETSPTFAFFSGMCFIPLTPNYLETNDGLAFREVREDDDGRIKDVPCKKPGDQIVVLSTVLKCEDTKGFDEIANVVVSKVNGKKIRNIHDLVRAFESNRGEFHTVLLKDKTEIRIKNMNQAELNALLKRFKIYKDRSDDLAHATTKHRHHHTHHRRHHSHHRHHASHSSSSSSSSSSDSSSSSSDDETVDEVGLAKAQLRAEEKRDFKARVERDEEEGEGDWCDSDESRSSDSTDEKDSFIASDAESEDLLDEPTPKEDTALPTNFATNQGRRLAEAITGIEARHAKRSRPAERESKEAADVKQPKGKGLEFLTKFAQLQRPAKRRLVQPDAAQSDEESVLKDLPPPSQIQRQTAVVKP